MEVWRQISRVSCHGKYWYLWPQIKCMVARVSHFAWAKTLQLDILDFDVFFFFLALFFFFFLLDGALVFVSSELYSLDVTVLLSGGVINLNGHVWLGYKRLLGLLEWILFHQWFLIIQDVVGRQIMWLTKSVIWVSKEFFVLYFSMKLVTQLNCWLITLYLIIEYLACMII